MSSRRTRTGSLAICVSAAIAFICLPVSLSRAEGLATSSGTFSAIPEQTLQVPKSGVIKVAFVVSDGTTLIDVAGPMQTFQQVQSPNAKFETFTVSATRDTKQSQGLNIVPDFTFADVPEADIVVVPAQWKGDGPQYLNYLRQTHARGKLIFSVCTGAAMLAEAGLLNGLQATTHHDYIAMFQNKHFPRTRWISDKAWVHSAPMIYTAGGETSGFELALHIVELYFGHNVAVETARSMEYRGPAWQA